MIDSNDCYDRQQRLLQQAVVTVVGTVSSHLQSYAFSSAIAARSFASSSSQSSGLSLST